MGALAEGARTQRFRRRGKQLVHCPHCVLYGLRRDENCVLSIKHNIEMSQDGSRLLAAGDVDLLGLLVDLNSCSVLCLNIDKAHPDVTIAIMYVKIARDSDAEMPETGRSGKQRGALISAGTVAYLKRFDRLATLADDATDH
eukprot:8070519-Pyramimonas_sp.AAC.2